MQKFLQLSILFILIACLLGLPAPAASQENGTIVRVEPAQQVLAPGETTTVQVMVYNVDDLWAFDIELSFDPDRLSAANLEPGGFLEDTEGKYQVVISEVDNELGRVHLAMTQQRVTDDDPAPREGEGILLRFDIQAKATAGQADLTLDLVEMSTSPQGGAVLIPHTPESGYVLVYGLVADTYQTPINETLVVPAPGVLANDILPAGETFTAELEDDLPPGQGILTWPAEEHGGFTYIPPADWEGQASFTYKACNAENQCFGPAAVTILVEGPDQPIFQVFLPLVIH